MVPLRIDRPMISKDSSDDTTNSRKDSVDSTVCLYYGRYLLQQLCALDFCKKCALLASLFSPICPR